MDVNSCKIKETANGIIENINATKQFSQKESDPVIPYKFAVTFIDATISAILIINSLPAFHEKKLPYCVALFSFPAW